MRLVDGGSGAPETAPWLGLAGPTASGKTAHALKVAAELGRPVEIVSVDSALVYRGMDIGTAKPSAAERARVPHHLIDLLDPSTPYSAAAFVADAVRLIGEIHARGAVPLLVGGTMLYFKALVDGLDAMPAANPEVRAALDAEGRARGWPAMHAELAEVDPVTAARLAPNDAQRIHRALEVHRLTGRALSSFHRRADAHALRGSPPLRLVALEPDDRAWLHHRIGQRLHTMLDSGFLDEVRGLRARGDLVPTLPSMRCVGYRQAWQALDEAEAERRAGRAVNDADLRSHLLATAGAATRQLAKRQLTWLRGWPTRHVVACDRADADQAVVQAMRDALR